ncbi:hypothetical protein ZWY2020_034363 [Hordeum vulgare]|nr:hypothetical protein ZWY2020_034363 [Hordeum vulgare]
MVVGPPPYDPGSIPVDHFYGFFFGSIIFTGLRSAGRSMVAAAASPEAIDKGKQRHRETILPCDQPPLSPLRHQPLPARAILIVPAIPASLSLRPSQLPPPSAQLPQVAVEPDKIIYRNFGIVQDGRDVTKDALEELEHCFQHELSPSVLAGLRDLSKLGDEAAAEIEDMLINRGGQAALDHPEVEDDAPNVA